MRGVIEQKKSSIASASSGCSLIDTRKSTKLEEASGMPISALGNAPLRVVLQAEDNPAQMMKLLDSKLASSRTVSRITVQMQLFRMSYKDQNMAYHIDQYASLLFEIGQNGHRGGYFRKSQNANVVGCRWSHVLSRIDGCSFANERAKHAVMGLYFRSSH